MSDLDAARAKHTPEDPLDPHCLECGQDWPCDFDDAIVVLDDWRAHYATACEAAEEMRVRWVDARALADELGRMLSEACWAIDHTCTQCGERQPAHTPRCPTYLAIAKWEASK